MAIAYRSVATAANTGTCSAPSGLTSGDVMLATVAWYDVFTVQTVTPPSGWTLLDSITSLNQVQSKTYWKVAGGSEPGSYTWTVSSGPYTEVGIIAYSGVDNTTPIDASSAANGSFGNVTAPSITTTVANTVLVAFLHDYGNAMSAPSGMTQRALWDGSINLIADEARASTGATGTRADGSAFSTWNAHLVALKPAGGGGGPATTGEAVVRALLRAAAASSKSAATTTPSISATGLLASDGVAASSSPPLAIGQRIGGIRHV